MAKKFLMLNIHVNRNILPKVSDRKIKVRIFDRNVTNIGISFDFTVKDKGRSVICRRMYSTGKA